MTDREPLARCRQVIVCSWCQCVLGTKEAESPGVTHSICESCALSVFHLQFTSDPQEEPQ
jgi:hypothetical protein